MTNDPAAGKAVLFDVDGTLLDTVPLIVETYQYIFQKWLGRPGDTAEILASIGIPLESYFRQFPADLIQPMQADYLEYNHSHLDSHVGIFLGIPQLLAALRQRGIPLGVVTSKRMASALHSLRGFGLESFFQVVIAKESTRTHKPEAEPVLESMRRLGLTDPQKIIFVGDSLHDLYCARNAGCRSAIVGWTAMPAAELRAAAPDFWLTKPDQLPACLDEI